MIDTKDLRRGNYINTPKGIEQVIDVLCDGVNTHSYHGITPDDIDGIPLSEDILMRCGYKEFYRSEWQAKYDNDEIDMQIVFKANRIMCLYGGKFLRDLYFVHQLQNLTHSITGQEITLK